MRKEPCQSEIFRHAGTHALRHVRVWGSQPALGFWKEAVVVGPFNKRGPSTPKMGHGTPKVGPGILTPAIPAGEAEQGHSSLLPSSPCPQARAGGRALSSSAGCRRRWQTRAARFSSSTPSAGSCSSAAGSGRGAAPVSSAAPLGSQGLVPGTKSAPCPLPNPAAVPPLVPGAPSTQCPGASPWDPP